MYSEIQIEIETTVTRVLRSDHQTVPMEAVETKFKPTHGGRVERSCFYLAA